jgi:transcriptional accessory protein Tex/SPT6
LSFNHLSFKDIILAVRKKLNEQHTIHLQVSCYSSDKYSKNSSIITRRLYDSFISRYRKDTTGNLDEVQIENIAKLQKNMK